MALLARARGSDRTASALAGITLAGCGFGVSCLGFYHSVAFLAWWTFALLGAWRGGRAGIAAGGLACGLALLAGEPILAALGLVPLLLVAIEGHGAARGVATAAAIGGAGLVVALPQVVATARILRSTFRGGYGMEAGGFALHPLRLVELVLPLPFGNPARIDTYGWIASFSRDPPLVFTLYFGVVALLLVAAAGRSRWLALAGAGLLLAWLGGRRADLFAAASAGLFRYPEKFLLWTALGVPLAAARGLARVVERRRLRGA
jgi:hypothetical protein